MKISILGLGWFGLPLADALLAEGHEVKGSTTTEAKKTEIEKRGIEVHLLKFPDLPDARLLSSDVGIVNIPPFEGQLQWFQEWAFAPDTWLIFISSTSALSGQSPLLVAEEDWVKGNFKSPTIIRFGGLFGAGRHPGKFLSGKTNLKSRRWPVNLIHLEDTIGVTQTVMRENIRNVTFEAVASGHPTREEYYRSWCKEHDLPLPEFDMSDVSQRSPVSNEFMLHFYTPKHRLSV